MANWTDDLPPNACTNGLEWCAAQPSLAAAWPICTRGDWLLWLLALEAADPEDLDSARVACAAVLPEVLDETNILDAMEAAGRECSPYSLRVGPVAAAANIGDETALALLATCADNVRLIFPDPPEL